MSPFYWFLTFIGLVIVLILLIVVASSIARARRVQKLSTQSASLMVKTPDLHSSSTSSKSSDGGSSTILTIITVLLIIGVLLYSGWQIFLSVQSGQMRVASGSPSIAPVSQKKVEVIPTPTKVALAPVARPDFQRGMIFPQWSQDAYADNNTAWRRGLKDIQQQTAARWIQMPVLFSQATPYSTDIAVDTSAPTITSFVQGIRLAHSMGYHVFFTTLLAVKLPAGSWAANVELDTYYSQQQWFDSYWIALKPYIQAAAREKVEQVAIGTEIEWMQQNASPDLWNTLITRVRSIFSGTIVYDMNWTSLYLTLPSWMSNQNLNMIGVSTYVPLVSSPVEVDPTTIATLWKEKIGTYLDALANKLAKKVLITEIGYRDTVDTLYNPWSQIQSSAAVDPSYQSAACDATLSNVMHDSNVEGIFFWGWDNVGALKLANQPATKILHKWYTAQTLS